MHSLLLAASHVGHEVEALVSVHPKYAEASGQIGPVRLQQIESEQEIECAVSAMRLPELVFTQIDWNRTAIRTARKLGIPVVHFSRVGDLNPEADFVVFNSKFVREHWVPIHPEIAEHSMVLYPTIQPSSFSVPPRSGAAVLAVNPTRAKGGLLLRDIARCMPDTSFVATRGWCDPLADGVDFRDLPNVELVAPQDGISGFAADCFAFVLPALWDEPFGRVIVEAMALGLPVVAVRRGGIPEAMGGAGVLLEPDAGVDEWIDALRDLQQCDERYRRERVSGLERADRYRAECDPAQLFERLVALRENYRTPRPSSGPPAAHVNGEWFVNLDEGL